MRQRSCNFRKRSDSGKHDGSFKRERHSSSPDSRRRKSDSFNPERSRFGGNSGEDRPRFKSRDNDNNGGGYDRKSRYSRGGSNLDKIEWKPRPKNENDEPEERKPRFNDDSNEERGERRPRFSRDKDNDREPRISRDNNDGEARKPRFSRDKSQYEDSKPRFNRDNDNFDRKPRFDRDNDRSEYKPRFSRDSDKKDFGDRKPRFDRESHGNDRGDSRPSFKKYPDNNSGIERKRFSLNPEKSNRTGKQIDKSELFRDNDQEEDNSNKKFMPKPNYLENKEVDPDGTIRLNKFISNAGVCSRREADSLIEEGKIKVNGELVLALGSKVKLTDIVTYKGKTLIPEKKVYILMNKPKDCVTTRDDPEARRTVFDILHGACTEQVHAVGRLDRNTTGVLLLTNDGEMTQKLTHPKFNKRKVYQVWLDKNISDNDLQQLARGIELEDGFVKPDDISFVEPGDRTQVGVEIHSGQNRVVRRMFEHLEYKVVKLDRVYFAGLTKKSVPRGEWRYLTNEEVSILKRMSLNK